MKKVKKILILAAIVMLTVKIIKLLNRDKPKDEEKQDFICPPILADIYNYINSFIMCLFMREKGTCCEAGTGGDNEENCC
ncbi:MAG: hypothetical protein FWF92_02645 [Oscillospiraceae bacterium]|nr:hypothetical protein [Oscillospiraceae bacterium]